MELVHMQTYVEDFAESYRLLRAWGKEGFSFAVPNRYEYFKTNFPELFDE